VTTVKFDQAVNLILVGANEVVIASIDCAPLPVRAPILFATFAAVLQPDAGVSAQQFRVRRGDINGEQVGPTSDLLGNIVPLVVDPAGQPEDAHYVLTCTLVDGIGQSRGVSATFAAIYS
jgi:hypothetical protein